MTATGTHTLGDVTRDRNRSILVCVIIIAVFFLFFRNNLRETTYVSIGDDALLIQSYDGREISVPYQSLEQMELTDEMEFGDLLDGTDSVRGTSGLWENAAYGEYYLYINKKVDDYLVLTTDTGTIVFNYESTGVTDSIYSGFADLMKEKGLDGRITFTATAQKGQTP
jgi:hypothetical protein